VPHHLRVALRGAAATLTLCLGAVALATPHAAAVGTDSRSGGDQHPLDLLGGFDRARSPVVLAARDALQAQAELDQAEQQRVDALDAWVAWVARIELRAHAAPAIIGATLARDTALAARDDALASLASLLASEPVAGELVDAWVDAPAPRRHVILWALAQHGLPYLWGGAGPDGFDCSGLTRTAWASVGVPLPHWSFGQNTVTADISAGEADVGDLVIWDNGWNARRGVRAGHVALVLGAGDLIVEAAGNSVRVGPLHTRHEIVTYGRVEVETADASSSAAQATS